MGVMSEIKKRARGLNARIVFPEGEDPRIIEAAKKAMDAGIAIPILVGNAEVIRRNAKKIGADITGISVIEAGENIGMYAKLYSKLTKTPARTAVHIARQPIIYSALMLRGGEADGMIGGLVYTSGDFIAVCKGVVGLEKGVSVPSSYFIMEIPGYKGGENGALLYSDASVNPNPTSEELADIALTTGRTAKKLLGWKPRVAMLSFSTKGSAVHPDVERVVKAVGIAKGKARGMSIDGELQADAALVPSTAKKKIKGGIGSVAGRANVLIFPDLDAGNISYKLTQMLARANAYGPVLQGFAKPLSDLSRGATVEDIYGTIAIVAVTAKKR